MNEESKEEEIREKILNMLSGREAYTKEIAEELSVSVTTASKHLNVLEAKGLLEKRRQKPYVYWKKKNNRW
ncbi:MAG: ArsR/SmtB family transcription factor [Halobacteriota archaeon]